MTRYRNVDGFNTETIKCDACGIELVVKDIDEIPEAWFSDNDTNQEQGFHICPECRYFGAAEYLAKGVSK